MYYRSPNWLSKAAAKPTETAINARALNQLTTAVVT